MHSLSETLAKGWWGALKKKCKKKKNKYIDFDEFREGANIISIQSNIIYLLFHINDDDNDDGNGNGDDDGKTNEWQHDWIISTW